MKNYTLTINEKQADVLVKALDAYSRIHLFQLEDVANVLKWHNRKVYDLDEKEIPIENLSGLTDALLDLKAEFLNCPRNASHGIYSQKISELARISYDLQQVIRYSLWCNDPEKEKHRHTVCSNEPIRASKEPLSKMNSVEELC
jgi:hypothetical protein